MGAPIYARTGKELFWWVTIAGQSSTAATTAYAKPEIDSLSMDAAAGGGSAWLSTHGGENVTLTGKNFGNGGGTLDWVRYGPTGTEYDAVGCAVSEDSVDPSAHEEAHLRPYNRGVR